MCQKSVSIAELAKYFDASNLTITASVVIKSIKHRNAEREYFYFDLHDMSGDICAVAYDDVCAKYYNTIQENETYTITGFSLEKSDRYYTSIEHPKELVLRVSSVIQYRGEVPPFNWIVESLDYDYDMERFSVAGMCIDISATELTPAGDKLVRRVKLVDKYGHKETLAVWNAETFLFDDLDLNSHPVFLAVDVRTYNYCNNSILTTSKYLKQLDPEQPIASAIIDAQAKYYKFCD